MRASARSVSSIKVVYVSLEPKRYPRVTKIAATMKKHGVDFEALAPTIKIRLGHSRILRFASAVVNYASFMLQALFIEGDVFWIANCPDILVLPFVLRRKQYVLDYRSPWPIEVKSEFDTNPLSMLSIVLERIALKYAQVFTVTSSRLKPRIQHCGKPVHVIPNFPPENFKPTKPRSAFRKTNRVKDGAKIVLFVGKLSRVEGVDMLSSIVSKVTAQEKNVVFWVVGDGPLRTVVEALARKNPVTVRFFGWKPYGEIPNFINASDVCIIPRHVSLFSSLYNEEGLQKVSEYMLFGKPIVACGIAKSKEYLLVKEDEMADGVLKALNGEAPLPNPKTWEDHCEKTIMEMLKSLA